MANTDINVGFNWIVKADPIEHPIEYSLVFPDGTAIPLTVKDSSFTSGFKNNFPISLIPTSQFDINVTPQTGANTPNKYRYGYKLIDDYPDPSNPDAFIITAMGFYRWLSSAGVKSMSPCVMTCASDDSFHADLGGFDLTDVSNYILAFDPSEGTANGNGVQCYSVVIDPITGEITSKFQHWVGMSYSTFADNVTIRDWGIHPITPWEEDHSTTGGGGGTSGGGEGTGINPEYSDTIGEPSTYGTDALLGGSTGAGFLTAFIPSKSDLENLGSILWARVFSEDWTDRVFQGLQKPMDYIAGLSIMPIPVPTSGSKQIRFGGIVIDQSAPSLPLASSQYPEFDCGEIKIEEYWGSALDYAPYTKISIFLPFIGTRELDTDEIMNKTMKVVYHFDIVGGVCSAMILLNGTVYYQFSGSCSQVVPLNARDYTSIATAGVQMAISAVGAVAAVASGAGAMATAGAIGASVGSAFNTIQSKPNIQHAGAVSGNAGMIGVLTPYLIVHRPKQSLAQGYNEFEGYPSNIATTLGNCLGFTKVESIHLDGVPATDTELEEIERRLKEGVLI